MPTRLYAHLTWTTLQRQPLINAGVADFLRRFLPRKRSVTERECLPRASSRTLGGRLRSPQCRGAAAVDRDDVCRKLVSPTSDARGERASFRTPLGPSGDFSPS